MARLWRIGWKKNSPSDVGWLAKVIAHVDTKKTCQEVQLRTPFLVTDVLLQRSTHCVSCVMEVGLQRTDVRMLPIARVHPLFYLPASRTVHRTPSPSVRVSLQLEPVELFRSGRCRLSAAQHLRRWQREVKEPGSERSYPILYETEEI